MSERRAREQRRRARALWLTPTPTETASDKVELGLRLRNEATVTGRCACGAVRETFEVLDDGTLEPVADIPPDAAGRAFYFRMQHEDDCPAISPELGRALEHGEINDPAGDLLLALAAEHERPEDA